LLFYIVITLFFFFFTFICLKAFSKFPHGLFFFPLLQWLFERVFFNFHIFVNLLILLLELVSSFILPRSEKYSV
jgi:hypothetical protein